MADRHLTLIARCTRVVDVVTAVRFAREHDLVIAVRGGGHSVAGFSTRDGGVVIDLSGMRAVEIDPAKRIARVQGGALLENYPGGTPKETSSTGPAAKAPAITGAGDQFTVVGQITYPNGETWQLVSLVELRDGKINRITDYFAAPFEAPAWRTPYVEKEAAAARSR